MRLLSWNARGLCKPEKRRLRQVLLKNKIDLVKTKKSTMTRFFAQSIWPDSEFGFYALDADGAAGGLICIWRNKVFKLEDCKYCKYFILLSGVLLLDFACVFVNVHAPNVVGDRKEFWEDLKLLRRDFAMPWRGF